MLRRLSALAEHAFARRRALRIGGSCARNPLIFLHVPKTGGTSLVELLVSMKPWRQVLTDKGHVTPPLLERYWSLPDAERIDTLIHGHPHHGIEPLLKDATLISILRDPETLAISRFLQVQREPRDPLYKVAQSGFDKFMTVHWGNFGFQSISLSIPSAPEPMRSIELFLAREPDRQRLLERIDVIGCTEDMSSLVERVAALLRAPVPPLKRRNSSADFGVATAQMEALRVDYRRLAEDPRFAAVLATERALYRMARKRAGLLP